MGKHVGLALILIFLLFFLPWAWGESYEAGQPEDQPGSEPGNTSEDQPGSASPAEDPPKAQPESGADRGLSLNILAGGQLRQTDMSDYLLGVLRAEMPASFEPEALKAQAVAARTFVLYRMANGGTPNHPEADACDDIACCQAYKPYEEAAQDWGDAAAEYEAKIRQAVEATDGMCVLYEGEPLLAAFHAASSQTTQDAAAVWNSSIPYLQSVETPESDETVPNYRSTASFTASELKNRLQTALPQADLSGSPSNWFTNIQQQPGGAVTSLAVGGVSVTGGQLRSILELRSACFTISFEGDTVIFSVTGYGHGLGMSQYGANVLAAGGMDYQEILTWYYTGATVGPYSPAGPAAAKE